MDLSHNSILNEVDLLYLSNHVDYGKIKSENIKRYNEDYIFYRERLIHQTLKLINNEKMKNPDQQIIDIFNKYMDLSIEHFKFIDKRDIIQEDYKHIKKKKEKPSLFNLETTNKMLIKKPEEKIGKITDDLDIQIIRNKKERKIIIPKKKVINLKDDMFKNKGIGKKENVNNIQENDTFKNLSKKIKEENKKKNEETEKKNPKEI
tara:strand:- start:486 stop:1100 length:615 start_codon:yes stop_codon:yes gene_type:complete